MPNTLGLDDDLDSVEIIRDIERVFDISISNDEAERIFTVGEMHDLLLKKISPNDIDRKCASAMAFYRMRSALQRLGYGERLAPDSDIRAIEVGRTRINLKEIENSSGLRMPKKVPTKFYLFLLTGGFFAILTWAIFIKHGLFIIFLAILLWFLFSRLVLHYFDPGKLPANCKTLRGLTKMAATQNYGRLVRMGARHTDEDVWKNLIEVLSHYALKKSDITRQTYFLQSQLKKHAFTK